MLKLLSKKSNSRKIDMMVMSLMTGSFLFKLKGCTKLKVALHLCFTMVASTKYHHASTPHMLTTKSLLTWQINCLFYVLELNIYCRFIQHSISARVNIIQTRWIRAHFPLPPKQVLSLVCWRLLKITRLCQHTELTVHIRIHDQAIRRG